MDNLNLFFSAISGGVEKIYSKVSSMLFKPKPKRRVVRRIVRRTNNGKHIETIQEVVSSGEAKKLNAPSSPAAAASEISSDRRKTGGTYSSRRKQQQARRKKEQEEEEEAAQKARQQQAANPADISVDLTSSGDQETAANEAPLGVGLAEVIRLNSLPAEPVISLAPNSITRTPLSLKADVSAPAEEPDHLKRLQNELASMKNQIAMLLFGQYDETSFHQDNNNNTSLPSTPVRPAPPSLTPLTSTPAKAAGAPPPPPPPPPVGFVAPRPATSAPEQPKPKADKASKLGEPAIQRSSSFNLADIEKGGVMLKKTNRLSEGSFVQAKKANADVPTSNNSGDIIAFALKKKFSSIMSPQRSENGTTPSSTTGDDWASPPQTEKERVFSARQGNLVPVFPQAENKENEGEQRPRKGGKMGSRRGSVDNDQVISVV